MHANMYPRSVLAVVGQARLNEFSTRLCYTGTLVSTSLRGPGGNAIQGMHSPSLFHGQLNEPSGPIFMIQ